MSFLSSNSRSQLTLVNSLFRAIALAMLIGLCACTGESQSSDDGTVELTEQSSTLVPAPFNYTPTAPNAGKLKGVVELGSKGFNSFIVTIDQQKNWKLENSDYGYSGVIDGYANGENVQVKLQEYIQSLLDQGVDGRDIHFVVSSGAIAESATADIISALQEIGYVANTVTKEEEGTYALECLLPKDYYDGAFVVDIGSGNTKISWKEGAGIVAEGTHGARYKSKGITDNQAFQDVRKIATEVPISKRGLCFIIGGIPFQMAKPKRHNNDGVKERYTILGTPDDTDYEGFTGDRDRGGLNIYTAIREGTGCEQYIFDWDSNFTIGFLLNLPY